MKLTGKEARKLLFDPIVENNPIALQILGICSALAVTVKMDVTLVMCAALTTVVAFSNFFVSIIRHYIPDNIRIIVQMTIISSLVIIVDEVLKEPSGGNNWAPIQAGDTLKNALERHLSELLALSRDELRDKRYSKFRKMGKYLESQSIENQISV